MIEAEARAAEAQDRNASEMADVINMLLEEEDKKQNEAYNKAFEYMTSVEINEENNMFKSKEKEQDIVSEEDMQEKSEHYSFVMWTEAVLANRRLVPTPSKAISSSTSPPTAVAVMTSPLPKALCWTISPLFSSSLAGAAAGAAAVRLLFWLFLICSRRAAFWALMGRWEP